VNKAITRLFWQVCQHLPGKFRIVDVSKAYLQSPAADGPVLLMRPPFELDSDLKHDGKVGRGFLRLRTAVYGSIDAGKQWHLELHHSFTENDWKRYLVEPCLYVKREPHLSLPASGHPPLPPSTTLHPPPPPPTAPHGKVKNVVITHVDDMAGKGHGIEDELRSLGKQLSKMKVLGTERFLGPVYSQTPEGVTISMCAYIESKIPPPAFRKIPDCPLPVYGKTLQMPEGSDSLLNDDEHRAYERKLGVLEWIAACMRFDIMYSVHWLKRFSRSPTRHVMWLLERLNAYVWHTRHYMLLLHPPHETDRMIGYSDSTWASQREGLKSQGGHLIGIEADIDGKTEFSPIAWVSKTQKRTARSSMNAEMMALSDMNDEMQHLARARLDMGLEVCPRIARIDSNDAVSMMRPMSYVNPKDKSLIVSVSMLREYVNDNKLEVRKWPRDRNLADELVKPTKCELLQSLFRIEST